MKNLDLKSSMRKIENLDEVIEISDYKQFRKTYKTQNQMGIELDFEQILKHHNIKAARQQNDTTEEETVDIEDILTTLNRIYRDTEHILKPLRIQIALPNHEPFIVEMNNNRSVLYKSHKMSRFQYIHYMKNIFKKRLAEKKQFQTQNKCFQEIDDRTETNSPWKVLKTVSNFFKRVF